MNKAKAVFLLATIILPILVWLEPQNWADTELRIAIDNKLHVDSELLNKKGDETFLILFKENSAMYRILKRLDGVVKVLHRYKIIPAILARGDIYKLLRMRGIEDFVSGIYANRKYQIKPLYRSIKGATTLHTASIVGATTFWSNGYTGEGIRVCVIDTGIYSSHPELEGRVVSSKSFVLKEYGYSSDETDPDDVYGHGTMVAGIIAGAGIDQRGQGMAPDAYLMNARVFASDGTITLAGVIAAIEWATLGPDSTPDTGDEADIINLSLGSGEIYGSPTYLAIQNAIEEGIIVVCAAGNEGDTQIGSMSINDPANSPYSIAVGAVSPDYDDVEYYTSIGPSLRLIVKPDIAAPSDVYVLSLNGGYTGPVAGTSFSSPHVAGSLALVLDYLKSKGIPKQHWPAVSRALIMHTASPLYVSSLEGLIRYEDLIIGAGLLNMTAAYIELNSSDINASTIPQWITILPRKIPVGISNSSLVTHEPYFPYIDRVFQNQTIVFNFTVVCSRQFELSVVLQGNITDALELHSPTGKIIYPPISLWEFNATIKPTALGYYSGKIVFLDTDNNISIEVPIEFDVLRPRARILIDLRHTSWVIDHGYGQYRLFIRELETLYNISVEYLYHNAPEISFDRLVKYDLLLCPDTASAEYLFSGKGELTGYTTDYFTEKEIEAIWEYIKGGGFLLIFALAGIQAGTVYHNLTNINGLLEPFGIEFVNEYIRRYGNPIAVNAVGKHILVKDIDELPYYGITLKLTGGMGGVFLKNGSSQLGVVVQNNNSGGVIALGTNFVFDNWAFLSLYPGCGVNGSNVKAFTRNLVDFILTYRYQIYGLTATRWSVARGESVTVYAYNSSPVTNIVVNYSSMFTEESNSAQYDSENGRWFARIQLDIAGPAYIKCIAYDVDGFYTISSITIGVEKDEENPPSITILSPDNGSKLSIDPDRPENVTIAFRLSDDTGIIVESINITISNVENYAIEYKHENNDVIVEVNISGSELSNLLIYEECDTISIIISCSDVNLNKSTSTYIFYLAIRKGAWIWILVVVILVILMVTLVYLFWGIRRRT